MRGIWLFITAVAFILGGALLVASGTLYVMGHIDAALQLYVVSVPFGAVASFLVGAAALEAWGESRD